MEEAEGHAASSTAIVDHQRVASKLQVGIGPARMTNTSKQCVYHLLAVACAHNRQVPCDCGTDARHVCAASAAHCTRSVLPLCARTVRIIDMLGGCRLSPESWRAIGGCRRARGTWSAWLARRQSCWRAISCPARPASRPAGRCWCRTRCCWRVCRRSTTRRRSSSRRRSGISGPARWRVPLRTDGLTDGLSVHAYCMLARRGWPLWRVAGWLGGGISRRMPRKCTPFLLGLSHQ